MKQTVVVILTAVFFGLQFAADAHDPAQLELRYDRRTNRLGVRVTHRVTNGRTHYIELIQVDVGGRHKPYSYRRQRGAMGIVRWYRVNAQPGETIQVTAHCSIEGEIDASLDVDNEIGVITGEDTEFDEEEDDELELGDEVNLGGAEADEDADDDEDGLDDDEWEVDESSYDPWIEDYRRRQFFFLPSHEQLEGENQTEGADEAIEGGQGQTP